MGSHPRKWTIEQCHKKINIKLEKIHEETFKNLYRENLGIDLAPQPISNLNVT